MTEADTFKCHYCLQEFPADQSTQDHIVPLGRDGMDETWNKVLSCSPCNERKADSIPTRHCPRCIQAINMQPDFYRGAMPRYQGISLEQSESLISLDDVKGAAFSDQKFDELISLWGLDEVQVAFRQLSAILMSQFTATKGGGAWRKRAGSLKVRVDLRLSSLRSEVKERNRNETATAAAMERKWSAFAERLARELYLLDPAAIRRLDGPSGGIDAEEWLHARIAQRTRRVAS